MIEHSADFLPLWMLIAAGFGFLAGELCGDYRRQLACVRQANEQLRDQLEKPWPKPSRSSATSKSNGA